MDEPSKRRKWRRWLERIAREVERLQREHQLYAEVRNALSCKPQWVYWIDTLYLMGVSLAIRRLADANPRHRTVSLVKLLRRWKPMRIACPADQRCSRRRQTDGSGCTSSLTSSRERELSSCHQRCCASCARSLRKGLRLSEHG